MKQTFAQRLGRYIANTTWVVFLFVLIVVAIFSSFFISREATTSAENLLHATIADIDNKLMMVEGSLNGEAWLVSEHIGDDDYLYHITQKVVAENPDIVGSAIAFIPDYFKDKYFFSPYSYVDDSDGTIKSKQLGSQQYNYFYMDWFQIPYLLGKPCWSEPYYDEGGGEYFMSTCSCPLKDSEGKVYAIITADVSLKWISEMVSEIKPYPNSYVTLFSRCGRFVGSSFEDNMDGETMFSVAYSSGNDKLLEISKAMFRGESGTTRYRQGKTDSFVVYGPMSNGWSASINCQYKDVLKNSDIMLRIIFIFGIIVMSAIYFFFKKIISKHTKPLSELSESALSIAGGNFHTVLPQIKSDDEIKALRDSFDTMQSSLVNYIENLKKTTSEKQRFESELNIASAIQMSMLPKNFPPKSFADLHAVMIPAKEVGGDLYDFKMDEKENVLYVVVGDVSGKGVPASLVMSITKNAFSLLGGLGLDVAQLCAKINDSVADTNDTGMFVTLFIGRIDIAAGEMVYCNAGHNPVVVIPPGKDAYFLKEKPNIALGLFGGFSYEKESVRFEKGTKLLFYTDGVTEAENADQNQFGEERLLAWATGAATATGIDSRIACDSLLDELHSFTAGNPQNDDITIMALSL